MWALLTEWGSRLGLLTALVAPLYGTLNYLQLTPVTQAYVTEQLAAVRKDITIGRTDTLDTRRTVLLLFRNDLLRERQAVEGAHRTETNVLSKGTWVRRLETLNNEIERIDRQVTKLDDALEEIRSK